MIGEEFLQILVEFVFWCIAAVVTFMVLVLIYKVLRWMLWNFLEWAVPDEMHWVMGKLRMYWAARPRRKAKAPKEQDVGPTTESRDKSTLEGGGEYNGKVG